MQRLTRKLAVREIPFEDARLDGTQPLQTFIFGNVFVSCIDLDCVKTEFDDSWFIRLYEIYFWIFSYINGTVQSKIANVFILHEKIALRVLYAIGLDNNIEDRV